VQAESCKSELSNAHRQLAAMDSAPASETKISELENDIIHKDETIKDLRKYHVYFFKIWTVIAEV